MPKRLNYRLLLVVTSALLLIAVAVSLGTSLLDSTSSLAAVVILGLALNLIAQYANQAAERMSETNPARISPDIEERLREINSQASLPSVTLSEMRKHEVVLRACTAFPYVVALRKRHLKTMASTESGKK